MASSQMNSRAVSTCLVALCKGVGFDVVELWSNGHQGFQLHHVHVDEGIAMSSYGQIIASYHNGSRNNVLSSRVCQKASESKHGFYWLAKQFKQIHDDIGLHTAVAFHLPRDNISSDVFIVGYANKYIKYTESRVDFLYWLSHAAAVAAFASLHVDEDVNIVHSALTRKASTGEMELDEHPREGTDGRRIDVKSVHLKRSMVVQPRFATAKPVVDSRNNANATLDQILNLGGVGSYFMGGPTAQPAPAPQPRLSGTFPTSNDSQEQEHMLKGGEAQLISGRRTNSNVSQETIDDPNLRQTWSDDMRAKARQTPVGEDFSIALPTFPVLVAIDMNVNLNELASVEYLTEGSNSNIMTAVWRNQPVIVKMLRVEKAGNKVAWGEFQVECELLSRIDHPNIVKLLGYGFAPRPFLILEKLRDISVMLNISQTEEVRPSIFHRRVFSYVEVLRLAKDLADAIKYLHSEVHPNAMIIHRDLKPENLGLTADGRLKLFDFGLCRCVRKRTTSDETYKMSGNTGSLRYMAPEVVRTLPYNETVDAYR